VEKIQVGLVPGGNRLHDQSAYRLGLQIYCAVKVREFPHSALRKREKKLLIKEFFLVAPAYR
jgi:hypothetical protein